MRLKIAKKNPRCLFLSLSEDVEYVRNDDVFLRMILTMEVY